MPAAGDDDAYANDGIADGDPAALGELLTEPNHSNSLICSRARLPAASSLPAGHRRP
jgi:hypothetical protein